MRDIDPEEIKWLAYINTALQWLTQDLNPPLLKSHAITKAR